MEIEIQCRSCSVGPESLLLQSLPTLSQERVQVVTVDVTTSVPKDVVAKRLQCDIVLVVDCSGSMSGLVSTVRETVLQIGNSLVENDRLAIVTFESHAEILLPLTPIHDIRKAGTLQKIIGGISARGSTNMMAGLVEACKVIQPQSLSTEEKFTSLFILSDGCPDSTLGLVDKLSSSLASLPALPVIVNSFGYGSGSHNSILLELAQTGNCGAGLYYSLNSSEDINSAVGDCLGTLCKVVGSSLKISGICLGNDKELPQWKCLFFQPQADNKLVEEEKLSAVTESTVHTFVMLLTGPTSSQIAPEAVCIKIVPQDNKSVISETYVTHHLNSKSIFTKMLSPEDVDEDKVHILAQLLRLKTVVALQHLCDPAALSIVPEVEDLHGQLLASLESVQQIDTPLSMRDERILSSLEQDVGEALEKMHFSKGNITADLKSRVISFAREHLYQKSASSVTNNRVAYATKTQMSMKLRFIYSNTTDGSDPTEVKSLVPVEEPGLNKEEIAKRKQADENLMCFITHDTWRDGQLGLGLLVQPRTLRERYKKLMPVVHLSQDYVSVDGYNSGVRGMFDSNSTQIDREDREEHDSHTVVKSSCRGRINAWLPLYINVAHWRYAKHYAPAAFSIIATQFNDLFRPEYALKVCAKLLVQSIVRFTVEEKHASEKAIQMYCDVHRLFLEMMNDYPGIQTEANEAIEKFIQEPRKRLRRYTTDLGDMIQYLTVTENYDWSSIRDVYTIEAIRRSVRHIGYTSLAQLESVDAILEHWMKESTAGRVTLFTVLFLEVVARPSGASLTDIKMMYDKRWGRITDTKMEKMKKGYEEIMGFKCAIDIFKRLGFTSITNEGAAEMILYAFANKDDQSAALGLEAVPLTGGPYLEEWKLKRKLWIQVAQQPVPPLKFLPHPRYSSYRKKNLQHTGIGHLLQSLQKGQQFEREEIPFTPASVLPTTSSSSSSSSSANECDCQGCQSNRALRNLREEWATNGEQHSTKTVFVHNLPPSFDSSNLKELFSKYGKVVDASVVTKKATGKSRGYGFVQFKRMTKNVTDLIDQELLLDCTVMDSNNEEREDKSKIYVRRVKGRVDDSFLPARLCRKNHLNFPHTP